MESGLYVCLQPALRQMLCSFKRLRRSREEQSCLLALFGLQTGGLRGKVGLFKENKGSGDGEKGLSSPGEDTGAV